MMMIYIAAEEECRVYMKFIDPPCTHLNTPSTHPPPRKEGHDFAGKLFGRFEALGEKKNLQRGGGVMKQKIVIEAEVCLTTVIFQYSE